MKYLCVLCSFIFLLSCDSGTKGSIVRSERDSILSIIRADTFHRFDTVRDKGLTVIFSPISKMEFDSKRDKGFRMPFPPEKEEVLYKRFRDQVRIKDSTITVLCTNGQKVELNSCPNTEESDPLYGFEGQLKSLPFFVFSVGHYESGNNELVNFRSGKRNVICGEPILSPNESKVASFYVYGIGGMSAGMELEEVHPDSLEQRVLKYFDYWSPDQMKWVDDNTLYMKQVKFDTNDKDSVTYAKVKWLD